MENCSRRINELRLGWKTGFPTPGGANATPGRPIPATIGARLRGARPFNNT